MAKMKLKTKGIIKKIALALAGVAALTAIGFGVKAIVDYTKNDLKTISPSFEVGNLGADGKFVDNAGTLYTKEAFACYGLQVKPDFDSTVNYQIFYYDILDNYISSTSFMSDGYSGEAPVNGAYARIVIEPRNDDDGKISLIEKVKYPSQLTVKVKKNQDINNRFDVFKGHPIQVVNDLNDMVFVKGLGLRWDTLNFIENDYYCLTSTTALKVAGGSTISFNSSGLSGTVTKPYCRVFQFKGLPLVDNVIPTSNEYRLDDSIILDKQAKYIIIMLDQSSPLVAWTDADVAKLPSCFTITKN